MALISAKEVFKVVGDSIGFLFMSKMGYIYWSECRPIKGESNFYPEKGQIGLWSYTNSIEEFQGKNWEDCLIENPAVIKNMIGKLCWFWGEFSDGNGSDEYISYESKIIGILRDYEKFDEYPYKIKNIGIAKECEPVQKSELKGMLYNGK